MSSPPDATFLPESYLQPMLGGEFATAASQIKISSCCCPKTSLRGETPRSFFRHNGAGGGKLKTRRLDVDAAAAATPLKRRDDDGMCQKIGRRR